MSASDALVKHHIVRQHERLAGPKDLPTFQNRLYLIEETPQKGLRVVAAMKYRHTHTPVQDSKAVFLEEDLARRYHQQKNDFDSHHPLLRDDTIKGQRLVAQSLMIADGKNHLIMAANTTATTHGRAIMQETTDKALYVPTNQERLAGWIADPALRVSQNDPGIKLFDKVLGRCEEGYVGFPKKLRDAAPTARRTLQNALKTSILANNAEAVVKPMYPASSEARVLPLLAQATTVSIHETLGKEGAAGFLRGDNLDNAQLLAEQLFKDGDDTDRLLVVRGLGDEQWEFVAALMQRYDPFCAEGRLILDRVAEDATLPEQQRDRLAALTQELVAACQGVTAPVSTSTVFHDTTLEITLRHDTPQPHLGRTLAWQPVKS